MVTVVPLRSDRRFDINTTSRSDSWTRGLSPFFLGPCPLYDGHVARNVENAWQFAKLYPSHASPDGTPTEEYWKWARKGWADDYARRYPMGRGAIPLHSWWKGEKLSYIEARKQIYIPVYARALLQSQAWKTLKGVYAVLGEITLADFDGYDHRQEGMDWGEVMNRPDKKMGHAFVIGMLLEGFLDERQFQHQQEKADA
jgi:hypothetical protein